METVEVLLFDVGGVLSREVISVKLRHLARRHGLALDKLFAHSRRLRPRADLGEISDPEFWEMVLIRAGAEPTPEDASMDGYLTAIDDTLDLVRRLHGSIRLAILSNDSVEMGAQRRDRFDFDDLFDPILISSSLGVLKPQPEAFEIAVDRLGVPAERILFIDDLEENVVAARKVGLKAWKFTGAQALERELKRRGLVPAE